MILRKQFFLSIAFLVVLLIFSFIPVPFLGIEAAKAEPATIVVPDDYGTVQEAIDAASEGDTVFVKNGIYNEPIEIHKPLTLLGENSQNTTLEIVMKRYSPPRVILVSADNVTISGFNIINSDTGIWVETFSKEEPDNCRIVGNNFFNNSGAINYYEGTNLTISGNNITATDGGICIYLGSSNCTVSDNNIVDNYGSGVYAYDYNITIKRNKIENNTVGIGLSGSGPYYICENNITENDVGIKFEYCSNATVSQNNLERNSIGVELVNIQDFNDFPLGSGNVVYCNNFIDNSQQVLVNKEYWLLWNYSASIINGTDTVSWDNGTVGNFWSNYQGKDKGDRIGDTYFVIDENNQDTHPLIVPWNVFLEPSKWLLQTIDTKCSLSGGISIALDSENNPHFCYNVFTVHEPEPDERYLVYTSWNGSTWESQRIDPEGWGGSLALDSDDNPHICYSIKDGLIYTVWNGTAWNSDVLSISSGRNCLVLDSNNNPHISYTQENRLMYATWSGSNWTIETVDSSGSGFGHVSLVLDTRDSPHIMYYDTTGQVGYGSGDTRYASWNGSAWDIQIAFPEISDVSPLVLDSNNFPHVSYNENINIHYARWDGSRWNTQNLGAITFTAGHIALDSEENPHILYSNDEILGYAEWNGSNWTFQIISTLKRYDGGVLVLDAYDNPHVSYFATPDSWKYGNLMYATHVEPMKPLQSFNFSIISPENKNYSSNKIPLTFTANAQVSSIYYNVDGELNKTITGNTTLTLLTNGAHNLTIYAENNAGNIEFSETIYFTISEEVNSIPEESYDDSLFLVIVGITFFLVMVFLIYLVKFKKKLSSPVSGG